MTARSTFYGAVVVLVAALVLSSSIAVLYYSQYESQLSKTQSYAGELSTALAKYRTLSASNDAVLSDYNGTLSLLADAVANLNTSSPAYRQASAALAALWGRYLVLSENESVSFIYNVRMLIDFGNGTRLWFNDTATQPGWNAYVTTLVLLDGKVQATWYPQYQEHFVQGLDGVTSGRTDSWFVWSYGKSGWQQSQTGADVIPVHNGTVFAWTLCGYNSNLNPTCSP